MTRKKRRGGYIAMRWNDDNDADESQSESNESMGSISDEEEEKESEENRCLKRRTGCRISMENDDNDADEGSVDIKGNTTRSINANIQWMKQTMNDKQGEPFEEEYGTKPFQQREHNQKDNNQQSQSIGRNARGIIYRYIWNRKCNVSTHHSREQQ